ncbi:MAG: sulfite exporter TauE/SafE family protein [Oscillospiraceae bacterium]|nr:sulfite exporter TauE/SafE family protein [Oscillospiraceae bacterium]
MKKEKAKKLSAGIASGFLNGLFGSGGGVVAVMFLRSILEDEKKAHASATLMILIMSAASLILYGLYGHVDWETGLKFVPGGIVGALLGTGFLKKMKNDKLKRLFGLVLAVSGAVMLLR